MRINDLPVTDAELDSFYGTTPSAFEVAEEIGKQATNLQDMGELTDALYEVEQALLDAIAAKDAEAIGNLVLKARAQRIADMASRAIYGRKGLIYSSEVRV